MKTNAIVRIVLYSLAILILTGILVTVLTEDRSTTPTIDNEVQIESSPAPVSATVATTATIYSVPNAGGEILGSYEPGTSITIKKQETVNGTGWALTSDGWVLTECLNVEAASYTHTTTLPGSRCTVDAAGIRKINIGWVAGEIRICAESGIDHIQISESVVENEDELMNVTTEGDELTIRFTDDDHLFDGITLGDSIGKNLLILVPQGWYCEELKMEVAAANVSFEQMNIGEMDFDGASGTCAFLFCKVNDLDIDTASGDVQFNGELTRLDFDAASASFIGTLQNCPEEIDMDGMSGDLELALPESCGFTVTMDGLSGNFRSEFGYAEQNGAFVSGDGRCRISVDGVSCDVYISKASEQK